MEKALIVTIKLKNEKNNWPMEDIAEEMEELLLTSGAEAVDNVTYICEKPTPNLFIGKGKAEEISAICCEQDVDVVVFSRDLSGTQQRNLEVIIGRKTIDRTQLILDIFAKHAKSPEGKTQVELAQLQYLLPRLTGKGIILSRLGGGIGTRGPGEQKLEVDRRRIRKRIDRLKEDLRHNAAHRKIMRSRRVENAVPVVALVGYTNAGKSTLLNTLTGSSQVVANSLFTTLDTIYKNFILPNGERIIICDTVGFLNNLPHHLIEAFKSTLEEVTQADLLVKVLDVSHPRIHERDEAVEEVLKSLDADNKPMIRVLNKIDLLDDQSWLKQLEVEFDNAVAISAKNKTNISELLKIIADTFKGRMVSKYIRIKGYRMDIVDILYNHGKIEDIQYGQREIKIKVQLPGIIYDKLLQHNDIEDISQNI